MVLFSVHHLCQIFCTIYIVPLCNIFAGTSELKYVKILCCKLLIVAFACGPEESQLGLLLQPDQFLHCVHFTHAFGSLIWLDFGGSIRRTQHEHAFHSGADGHSASIALRMPILKLHMPFEASA